MLPFLQLRNPLKDIVKIKPNRCAGVGGSMSFFALPVFVLASLIGCLSVSMLACQPASLLIPTKRN